MNRLKKAAQLRHLREVIVSQELGIAERQDRRLGLIPDGEKWFPTPLQHQRAQDHASEKVREFKLFR